MTRMTSPSPAPHPIPLSAQPRPAHEAVNESASERRGLHDAHDLALALQRELLRLHEALQQQPGQLVPAGWVQVDRMSGPR